MRIAFANFLLGSVLVAAPVFAQSSGTPPNPPSPANMAQHRVKFLTTLLSLTASQQQQATTIFTNAATSASGLMTSMRTAHEALRAAVRSNDGAAIDQSAGNIGNLTTQLTALNAKADAAFYQTLTPDQQTKLTEFESQGHGRFGPGMGGGVGPAGAPGPRR